MNSGMPDTGSSTGLVNWFAAWSPAQWYGMKTVSGRIVSTTLAGRVIAPRRYPELVELDSPVQLADHLAYGVTVVAAARCLAGR